MAQLVKHLPAMRKSWVRSLGWEDPIEKGKATHSSILAWRIPWTSRKESDTLGWVLIEYDLCLYIKRKFGQRDRWAKRGENCHVTEVMHLHVRESQGVLANTRS